METKRMVKVTMAEGWTTYFVCGLFRDNKERDAVYKFVEENDEPILMDAHGNEVVDFDTDFDWWWERAYQCVWKCMRMDCNAIRGMIQAILNGSEAIGKCVLSNGKNETTIEVTVEPIKFHAEFVEDVKKANGGRFINVPYRVATMNLASLKATIDRLVREHPELVDKPVKVEEYWDADEPVQDVYGIEAEDGFVLINKGRNEH